RRLGAGLHRAAGGGERRLAAARRGLRPGDRRARALRGRRRGSAAGRPGRGRADPRVRLAGPVGRTLSGMSARRLRDWLPAAASGLALVAVLIVSGALAAAPRGSDAASLLPESEWNPGIGDSDGVTGLGPVPDLRDFAMAKGWVLTWSANWF